MSYRIKARDFKFVRFSGNSMIASASDLFNEWRDHNPDKIILDVQYSACNTKSDYYYNDYIFVVYTEEDDL